MFRTFPDKQIHIFFAFCALILLEPFKNFLFFDPDRSTTQARGQQERKKVKARRAENRNRYGIDVFINCGFNTKWQVA